MPRRRSFLAAPIAAAAAGIGPAAAADAPAPDDTGTIARIRAMDGVLDAYVARGMRDFDVPGLAIGIVGGGRLVYGRGFGVCRKSGGQPVDTRTVFQIGSATKAFLATAFAIMVDRGRLAWDDRVADLYPPFQMMDPWVTREFRVFDLLAQRSGLPPLANDMLAMLDFDEAALIRSLRDVEPVTSFRTTFAYTNVTHLLASRVLAQAAGVPDWNVFLQRHLLDPLGMRASTYTAEAIEAAANHARGHRWTPAGTVEVPLTPIFPYRLAGAGNINSNVEDMAAWLRLQLARGVFEGRPIVSREALAVTRMPKVALSDVLSYAMGWYVLQTPNGPIVWHDGDALSYGSFVGMAPGRDAGVVILTNETNVGFPTALGAWVLDRILGNPETDRIPATIADETARFERTAARFAAPAHPRPPPPLAALTGRFGNPSFGETVMTETAGGLAMDIEATGAKLHLAPWDGDVFVASLAPSARFQPIVALEYMTRGFAQFRVSADGRRDTLSLTVGGQCFAFQRR